MHPWHDFNPGTESPDRINVVIEIPKGSRNKYELDKETGAYHLSRVLYSPMIYPGDYGFIPQSYYEDGDPLDVLVLINESTFTGCIIEVRPVGIFRMLDKGEPDDKILCVPTMNPFFGHIHDLKDVPPHFLKEVAHFFAVYKDLEGSRTLSLGWEPAETARKQIMHALKLYRENFGDASAANAKQREIKKEILQPEKRKNANRKSAPAPAVKPVRPAAKAVKKSTVKSAKKPKK